VLVYLSEARYHGHKMFGYVCAEQLSKVGNDTFLLHSLQQFIHLTCYDSTINGYFFLLSVTFSLGLYSTVHIIA